MFSCKGPEYEYDDMDELIKAVPKPLYFFLIQNCCIIEALMMVILIDVKKKKVPVIYGINCSGNQWYILFF